MLFNRLIVKNVERESLQEAAQFIYKLASEEEEAGTNDFCVSNIDLLDNGWVEVTRHDTGIECFPPWRVVALEFGPTLQVVPDRVSDG